MSANQNRYRWDNPHDWLFEKAATWSREKLLSELRNLAVKLDGDDIQEEYQDDMDADGFFDELHEHEKDGQKFEGKAEDCPICEEEEDAAERG